MKNKSPYTYPHHGRTAIVEYLATHESYGGWNHPFRKWSPLAWNVKIGTTDNSARTGEYKTNPEFDEAWEKHVSNNNELWVMIVEDMQRHYTEGEYTTYPGDDQGDWQFCFAGRSGGHMLLESWKAGGVDFLRRFDNEDSWREWLMEVEYSTLYALYRAVRCMDQDFGLGAVEKEFEYQLNFQRNQWEEEHAREVVFEKAKEGLEPHPQI